MAGGSQIKIKGGIASKGEAVVEDGALLVTGITIPPAVPTTLQEAYDASGVPPHIVVDGVNLGVSLQDNATPLGTNLFDVRDNTGTVIHGVSIANPLTTRVVSDVGQNQITLNANPVLSTARPWAGINFLAPIDAGGTAIFDSARIYSGFAAGSGFDKAYLVLGTGSGAGAWTDVVTIRASRVGINTGGGDVLPFGILVVRDLGVPATRTFSVENNTPAGVFSVNEDEMSVGLETRRLFRAGWSDPVGRIGMEFLPDDMTVSSVGGEAFSALFTDVNRTITLNIPGGGGIGNETAPSGMNFPHTVRFEDTGFLFASQLLVNAAVKIECATNTVGPLYLFLDQYVTYADGGSRTCTQHNAMRAQPAWGPNINGGSITQTSAQLFFCTATVDATVGSATVTTLDYFMLNSPILTAGGTIGTLNCINIANIAGPGQIRGINSVMSNGTFINHQGSAASFFQGDIYIGNAIFFHLGNIGAAGRIDIRRNVAGVMSWLSAQGGFNEGLDWTLGAVANVVEVTSPTGAALRISNRLDINNGIALGGGVAPTLGTIGGAGPTAAAQAQWLEVDINGVAHWIPVWV